MSTISLFDMDSQGPSSQPPITPAPSTAQSPGDPTITPPVLSAPAEPGSPHQMETPTPPTIDSTAQSGGRRVILPIRNTRSRNNGRSQEIDNTPSTPPRRPNADTFNFTPLSPDSPFSNSTPSPRPHANIFNFTSPSSSAATSPRPNAHIFNFTSPSSSAATSPRPNANIFNVTPLSSAATSPRPSSNIFNFTPLSPDSPFLNPSSATASPRPNVNIPNFTPLSPDSPSSNPSPAATSPRPSSGAPISGMGALTLGPSRPVITREDDAETTATRAAIDKAKASVRILLSKLDGLAARFLQGPSVTIERLRTESKQLLDFQPRSTTKIALFGDTGSGKSSLINALLSEGRPVEWHNIARSGASGSACTVAAVEYKSASLLGTPTERAYTARIKYLTPQEWVDEVQDLAGVLCDFGDLNNTDGSRDLHTLARDAEARLKTVFHTYSVERLKTFANVGCADIIKQETKSLVPEVPWPLDSEEFGHDTGDSFMDELYSKFGTDNENSRATEGLPWPLFKNVEIFIKDSPILDRGVILVDLPGLHDSNQHRARITQDYITYCNEIFVVADIARCVVNNTAREMIDRAMENQLRMNNRVRVSFVCTKSDIIDEVEAARELESIRERVRRERRNMDELRETHQRIKDEIEQDADFLSSTELRERTREKKRVKELLRNSRDQLRLLCCKTRAEVVKRKLEDRYNREDNSLSVKVFCVSSDGYQKLGRESRQTFFRLPEDTGIPQLRENCVLLPTQHRKAEMENTLAKGVQLFLDVRAWLESDALGNRMDRESAEALERILSTALGKLEEDLIVAKTNFEGSLREKCDDICEAAEQAIDEAHKAAVVVSQEWGRNQCKKHHHNTYRATCSRHGVFLKRPTGGPPEQLNWNYDLSRAMIHGFEPNWVATFGSSSGGSGVVLQVLAEEFTSAFLKFPTYVTGDSYFGIQSQLPITIDALLSGLSLNSAGLASRNQQIAYLVSELQEFVDRIQRGINNRLLFSDEALVKVEMIPAYDRCASENGIGMWARMKNIMTGHIASPASPVLRTLQRLPLALQDELDELVTSASGKVGDEVDRIIRSLKDRCDELVHRRSNEERQQNEELAEEKREISVFLEEELNGWSLTIPTRT